MSDRLLAALDLAGGRSVQARAALRSAALLAALPAGPRWARTVRSRGTA